MIGTKSISINFILFLLIFRCFASALRTAHILCLVTSPEHKNPGWSQPLFNALADRGHRLTIVSTAVGEKNLKERSEVTYYEIQNKFDILGMHYIDNETGDFKRLWSFQQVTAWYEEVLGSCSFIYKHTESFTAAFKMKLGQAFDLIIFDAVNSMDCMLRILPVLDQVPKIAITGGKLTIDLLALSGGEGTVSPSRFPHFLSELPSSMNYWQRIYNHMLYVSDYMLYYGVVERAVLASTDEYPRLALTLLNTHPVLDYLQNLPPNIVEIGGLHIRNERAALPVDIEEFLEDYEHGVILISTAYIETMFGIGTKAIQNLLETFPDLGFLWNVKNVKQIIPHAKDFSNLHIASIENGKQQDILSHSSIKAFITHGDSFSLQEAIYHAKPIIVLPLFQEQINNGRRIEERGLGIVVQTHNFSITSLSLALKMLMDDQQYLNNIYKAQTRFCTRPLSPINVAIWHVEQLLSEPHLFNYTVLDESQNFLVRHSFDVLLLPVVLTLTFIGCIIYLTVQVYDAYNDMQKNKPSKQLLNAASKCRNKKGSSKQQPKNQARVRKD